MVTLNTTLSNILSNTLSNTLSNIISFDIKYIDKKDGSLITGELSFFLYL